MIKALLKKQLSELFAMLFYDRKRNRRVAGGKAALYIGLYILLFVMVIAYSGMMAVALGFGGYLTSPDYAWAYYGMAAVVAITLAIVGSVFVSYNTLYKGKDNEFLLSLPVPPSKLLFTKLLSVWLSGFMWETLVLLPFYVVSWIIAPTLITPLGIIFQILLWLGISFVILFMIAILGWVIAKIATHLGRFKTLVIVLLFLGGFVGYMVLISQLENGINTLFEDPAAVANGFGSFVPALAFGKACLGDALYGSIFFLICAGLFALLYWVLSITFTKMISSNGKGKAVTSNKREDKQRSVNHTLISREFRHFFSNPMYILNTSLGYVFFPIIGVLAIFNRDTIQGAIANIAAQAGTQGTTPEAVTALMGLMLPVLVFFAVMLLCGMSVITAPSVSLEGKKIAVLQALPISMKQILWSKIEFHCIIALPFTLISTILISIGLSLDVLNAILVTVLAAVIVFFYGVFGLACNLKWPMIDWKNENMALKQSMPVLICLLVGFLSPIIMTVIYFFVAAFVPPFLYLIILGAILGLFSWLLLRWINTKGAEKFQYLN